MTGDRGAVEQRASRLESRAPVPRLRELGASGSTGELMCVVGGAEVHIYFQRGCVAWATSSRSRFAFARHLVEECGIAREDLRELVELCRSEKRALGETLIEWRIASAEAVRRCLERQIVEALGTLLLHGTAEMLFIPREQAFSSYDPSLTFPVDALLARVDLTPGRSLSERTSALATASDGSETRATNTALDAWLVESPGALWYELRRCGTRARHRARVAAIAGVPLSLAQSFEESGVERAVLRDASETFVGIRTSSDEAVWLAFDRETSLGEVLSAMTELRLHGHRREPWGAVTASASVEPTPNTCGGCPQSMAEVMANTPGLTAVLLLAGGQTACGVHRDEGSGAELTGLAGRCARFDPWRNACVRPSCATSDALGYESAVVGVAAGGFLYFGTCLGDGTDRSCWLVLDRATHEGLGWALVSSMARIYLRTRCGLSPASDHLES